MDNYGFIATLLQRDRKAVETLREDVRQSADKAIGAANALEQTIQGMIDRKRDLDRKPAHARKRF